MRFRHSLVLFFLMSPLSYGQKSSGIPKAKGRSETRSSLEERIGEKASRLLDIKQKKAHSIEFRPNFSPQSGSFYLQNAIELTHSFNENRKLSYVQFFRNDLYDAREKKNAFNEPDFRWQDSYFSMKWSKLWESQSKNTAFSIQNRVFLPLASRGDNFPSRINQGIITLVRNYFSIKHKVFSFMEADFAYIPSFFISRKDGYTTRSKKIANPVFEHYFSQTTDLILTKTLLFSMPFYFRTTKYRNYHDAAPLNNSWSYTVSMEPELDWSVNDIHTLGLVFSSDNIVNQNGTNNTWKTAFTQGQFQLLWNIKF